MFEFLSPSSTSTVIECANSSGCVVVHSVVSTVLILFVILTGFAYTTVLERRFIAWVQDRIGPNRVGPKGLLQPLADGVKLVFKEDIIPANADKAVYLIAPMLKVIPALILLAVVPLGPPLTIPWFDDKWYRVSQGFVDVNVGVLWLLAITSLSVYGVAMAGWSSSNKYAMIGSLRASASMISYELPLGASFLVPIMLAQSASIGDIIEAQSGNFIFNWFIFQNPLAAIIMLTALIAEINRAPFDLPEAEQELVAGHMTEYSGMRFAMFFMAEYIGMIAVSVIFSCMFLGGYHFILTDQVPILGPIWLTLKVVPLLAFMVWIRAALPRIRYDRLMAFGWKVLLPLALLATGWTAVIVVISAEYDSPTLYLGASVVLFVLLGLGAYIFGRQTPDEDYHATHDVEVVKLGGQGIGFVILQLVGSLIAVPFMLFNYQVNVLKNLRAALPETRSKPNEESTEVVVREHS
jgi:NADH-quinone oxidoreductase subunit H